MFSYFHSVVLALLSLKPEENKTLRGQIDFSNQTNPNWVWVLGLSVAGTDMYGTPGWECALCFRISLGAIDLAYCGTLYRDLKKGLEGLVLESLLHLVYLTTPYDLAAQLEPDWMVYFRQVRERGCCHVTWWDLWNRAFCLSELLFLVEATVCELYRTIGLIVAFTQMCICLSGLNTICVDVCSGGVHVHAWMWSQVKLRCHSPEPSTCLFGTRSPSGTWSPPLI